MEVYVIRKLENDGTKEVYIKNVKKLICYEIEDHLNLNLIDYNDNYSYIYKVIKLEVY